MKVLKYSGILCAFVLITFSLQQCNKEQLSNVSGYDSIVSNPSSPSSLSITAVNNAISEPSGSVPLEVRILPISADQSFALHIIEGAENADLTNNILTAIKNGSVKIKAISTNSSIFNTFTISLSNQGNPGNNLLIIQDTTIQSDATRNADVMNFQPKTPLKIIFKNNIITAQNSDSHIIIFGGENPGESDQMLDNIIISGNKITWNGTDLNDGNEGILTGFSTNPSILYNLMVNCPYGTPVKSNGLINTCGFIAYNVYGSSFKVGAASKGTSGMKFYNNTFYNIRNVNQGVIGSIYLNSNTDNENITNSTAKNCEIYNNIFYTKHQVYNIYCDNASLEGLKCDYNLYYCEDGVPLFKIKGQTITFKEWQAMGFDCHSIIMDPHFTDFTSLIPLTRLNYGKPLEINWNMGLSGSNKWNGSDPLLKAQDQIWQVGAYVVK